MGGATLHAEIFSQLDQLDCGTIYLTVPLSDEKIQVGSSQPLPTATIAVTKISESVTVRRTDGVALQAQIVEQADDGSVLPTDVFAEPVPVLGIRRVSHPDGAQQWLVNLGARSRRNTYLEQLIKTIVSFSIAKQRNTASCRVRPPG